MVIVIVVGTFLSMFFLLSFSKQLQHSSLSFMDYLLLKLDATQYHLRCCIVMQMYGEVKEAPALHRLLQDLGRGPSMHSQGYMVWQNLQKQCIIFLKEGSPK